MTATRKLVLIIEYDGTGYNGLQLQAARPTIQGEIEKALLKLTGESLRILAASRTDSGVHARGQVVSLRTASALQPEKFVSGLNHYLPADIAVKAAYPVPDSFDVRRRALSREYSYFILNSDTRSAIWRSYSYTVRGGLDVEAMDRACRYLVGERDFASFASDVWPRLKNTVRKVLQANVARKKDDLVIFKIVGNSFLPHQVRNTAGTLLRIGQGQMNMDGFCSIIEAKKFGLAGPTIPARGLFLMKINYPVPWSEMNEDL